MLPHFSFFFLASYIIVFNLAAVVFVLLHRYFAVVCVVAGDQKALKHKAK